MNTVQGSFGLAAFLVVATTGMAQLGNPVEEWRTTLSWANHSALDSRNNLLVSGQAVPGFLFQTTKIAPDGTVSWARQFDLPGGVEIPVWIAVDSQDNVVHGGYTEGTSGGPWGFLVVKYDRDGNLLWHSVVQVGTTPEARRIAVDEFDDIYVFGEVWGGLSGSGPTGNDFLTVKVDSSGALQWARVANRTGSDEPYGMAVRNGFVAVTGRGGGPFLTVCYDYAGNELWKQVYLDGIAGAFDVAIGPSDEVVVCGWGAAVGSQPYAGTVLAYDSSGRELWRVLHNGPNGLDNLRRLAIDADGSVAAFGWCGNDWAVQRIDAAGTLQWARYFNGTSATFTEEATLGVFGPDGSLYVVGEAGPSCTGLGLEGAVMKYAPDGTQTWRFQLACGSFPHSVALDTFGALMIGGDSHAYRVRESGFTRYGCGANPGDSLTVLSGTATIGSTVVFGVENPLATQPPGSLPFLIVGTAPDPAFPCGTSLPGFGMAGGGAPGELLVSLVPSTPSAVLPGAPWSGAGPAPIPLRIPAASTLIGAELFLQGLMISNLTSGGSAGLTEALDMFLGAGVSP